ncbi:MAG: DUF4249 domain-containing protein [Bacteroidota bacterium]
MRRRDHLLLFLMTLGMSHSCIEEIDISNKDFENALVVDATITDVEGIQEVRLSRTYPFEADGPTLEAGATVSVMANDFSYPFTEASPGRYVSNTPFAAIPGLEYQLIISTAEGRSYRSNVAQLSGSSEIERVYAIRETNDNGVNGMSMYVDSFDPDGNAKFYQYEYEETFRVEPPYFVNLDLANVPQTEPSNCPECEVELVPRSEDKRICYRTETSRNTLLGTTVGFTEDRISRFLVRFVKSDDYRISHRYSILVRQLVLSEEVYNYKRILNSFSEQGSLFSQVQPGVTMGNILSETSSNEMVVGYFAVASVATKRLFFNYDDFYPNEPLPPYLNECIPRPPFQCVRQSFSRFECGGLIKGIRANTIVYKGMNTNQSVPGGPYLVMDRECGDCTALGSSEPPDFWIE